MTELARAWVALWCTADRVAFDRIHDPSFVDRASGGRPSDRDGFYAGVVALRAALPDLEVRADDVIVAEDRGLVTVRWSGEGTHRGPYLGHPATGRRIRLRGIEIVRVAGDRIVERWGEWDGLDLLAQLSGP